MKPDESVLNHKYFKNCYVPTPKNREEMAGYNNLIKLFNRYLEVIDSRRHDITDKNIIQKYLLEEKELEMGRYSDFINKISSKIPIYYDPKIDYTSIDPILKLVETQNDKDIWRYLRYIVSTVPQRQVVGRNLRYFLWDNTSDTVLGIMQLSSTMLNLKMRNDYLHESMNSIKEKKILNGVPNMATCVPLQPFGTFTGGKLISMMTPTKQIMDDWENVYGDHVYFFDTTSIYGKSIQYDRLKEWKYIGKTKGYSMTQYSGININKIVRYLSHYSDTKIPTYALGITYPAYITHVIHPQPPLPVPLNYNGVGRGYYISHIAEQFQHQNNIWKFLSGKITYDELDFLNRDEHEQFLKWKDRWFKRRWDRYSDTITKYDEFYYCMSKCKQMTLC